MDTRWGFPVRRLTALLLLSLLPVAGLSAQSAQVSTFARWSPPPVGGQVAALRPASSSGGASVVGMTAGGLLGGAVGFAGGALIGATLGGGNAICGDDACGLEEAAYGAIAGQSILLPLGVHIAHGRRGNYGFSLITSVVIGAAGIVVVDATNDGAPFIAVPVLQLVSSILIERATSK